MPHPAYVTKSAVAIPILERKLLLGKKTDVAFTMKRPLNQARDREPVEPGI